MALRTADEHREYMRNYMRVYRSTRGVTPQPQPKKRRRTEGAERVKNHERYLRSRERRIATSRAYALAHPDKQRTWKRESRERSRPICAFCGTKTYEGVVSCPSCRNEFGNCCKDNAACGVVGVHKHCPCGMPTVPNTKYRQIEVCGLCLAEMRRTKLSLSELFMRGSESTEDEEAA